MLDSLPFPSSDIPNGSNPWTPNSWIVFITDVGSITRILVSNLVKVLDRLGLVIILDSISWLAALFICKSCDVGSHKSGRCSGLQFHLTSAP